MACAVLHNICIDAQVRVDFDYDNDDDDDDDGNDEDDDIHLHNAQDGIHLRQTIVQRFNWIILLSSKQCHYIVITE